MLFDVIFNCHIDLLTLRPARRQRWRRMNGSRMDERKMYHWLQHKQHKTYNTFYCLHINLHIYKNKMKNYASLYNITAYNLPVYDPNKIMKSTGWKNIKFRPILKKKGKCCIFKFFFSIYIKHAQSYANIFYKYAQRGIASQITIYSWFFL